MTVDQVVGGVVLAVVFAMGWLAADIARTGQELDRRTDEGVQAEEKHRLDALVCYHRKVAGTGPFCTDV